MAVKSKYIIVGISLIVGLLHFVIGPNYSGPFKEFVSGYLMDILLPGNLYLLLQITLRKHTSVLISRLTAASFTFIVGLTVELLQYHNIPVFGSTYDPMDILMYALSTGLGFVIDFGITRKFEKPSVK